jgi:hypothetical protein
MAQEEHLKKVYQTERSNNMQQRAIWCE